MTGLEHTARHEAGHAVVSHALRSRVEVVNVEPTETTLGHVAHRHSLDDETIEAMRELAPHQFVEFGEVRRVVAVLVAGSLAAGDMVGCGPDFERAQRIAMNAHGGDERVGAAFLDYCARFAMSIVTSHQRQIDAVAAALLERKTLHGDAFREVFATAGEGPT